MPQSLMKVAPYLLTRVDSPPQLVTVSVLYYLPDHRSLVNEFVWQTLDCGPRYARVEAFLDYWKREINAIIKEVSIGGARPHSRGRVEHVSHRLALN